MPIQPIRNRTGFKPLTAPTEDVIAALLGLYSRQTVSEQTAKTTAEQNGVGFNAYDAGILTSIAERVLSTGQLTERMLTVVRNKLGNYRRQISQMDLAQHRLPNVKVLDYTTRVKEETPQVLKCTEHSPTEIRLEFGYDSSLVNKIKALSGRRYHKHGAELYWTVPKTAQNLRAVLNMGFVLPPHLLATFTPAKTEFSTKSLLRTLRPYQVQGATRLAGEMDLRGLLADEMGLGKTAQALAAVEFRRDDAFPVLVVCPSSLKWNWAREAQMWLKDVCVRVLSGYCHRGIWRTRHREITIINDDILADQVDSKTGKVRNRGWFNVLNAAGFKTLILDECHREKNNKRKSVTIIKEDGKEKTIKVPACKKTYCVLEMAKTCEYFLPLSGTPIENRPVEFFPVLNALCPERFPSFWNFAQRYCGAKSNGWGWDFSGSSNTDELHSILTNSIMVRRLKKDVLKDLPPKTRTVLPVEINLSDYKKAEQDFLSYVARLRGATAAEKRDSRAEGLAKVERLKQAAAVGKIGEAIDWIQDYLESGRKLVVFAIHKFILDILEKKFKKICVRVDGSTAQSQRQVCVDAFQSNDDIKLFLGNIKAAGVGLTLTAASDTLTLELGWTPGTHDQAEDRVHRIGQEADSVNAYYLIAKDTIEEDIAELLDAKRDVLSNVMDGKSARQGELLTVLMERYINKLGEE